MIKKLKIVDLPDFDMAEMLKTEEDVANYLTLVLEENDIGEFTYALGVVARARGMSSQPRFDTIYKVCRALGVRLVAQSGPAPI